MTRRNSFAGLVLVLRRVQVGRFSQDERRRRTSTRPGSVRQSTRH